MKKDKYNIIIIILLAIVIGLVIYLLLFGKKTKVSSISIVDKNISIFVGERKEIELSILPEEVKDIKLTFTSSNTNIATVDSNGIITGISNGDTILTVKDNNTNISDSCMVRVINKEASELVLLDNNIKLKVNESKELKVVINPIDFKDLITWTSSDERVAIVDSKGIVTAVGYGNAEIKAVYGNREARTNVNVYIPVDNITLDKDHISLPVNTTTTIKPTVTPTEASNQEIIWESSNPSVATIDNGLIKGISEGKTTITVSIGDKKAIVDVVVIIPVESIKLNKTSLTLKKDDSETLIATINPSNVTNKQVTWKSSNDNIVSVDNNGKVTGKGTGTVTITASIDGKSATCTVKSIGYIITQDTKFNDIETIDSYDSETLKYSIKNKNGNYVIIWVMDANKQFNSALLELGTAFDAEVLLGKEITTYGYQNKGLVAVNGSYFWAGWGDSPALPFIINKGKIVRDIENKTYTGVIYGALGIDKNSHIKTYTFSKDYYNKNSSTKQAIINDGVRSIFSYTLTLIDANGKLINNSDRNGRTVICQVDENNYVLYSGGSLSFTEIARELKSTYNCKLAYNLDGGGSRKLYYKTGSMKEIKKVFGGDRKVPDMLYFVEQ